jgi:hypothetical protein
MGEGMSNVLPDVDLDLVTEDRPECCCCWKESVWMPVFERPVCDCNYVGVCDEHRRERDAEAITIAIEGWTCPSCDRYLGIVIRWERA